MSLFIPCQWSELVRQASSGHDEGTMAERATWKILFRDTLLILVFSVALLAGLEVALRVIFPDSLPPPMGELAYEFHPDYLVALKPSIERVYQRAPENGGQAISWHTNEIGIWGAPVRPNASPRIVVYGDSNVQARFSRLEDTFASQLERHLAVDGAREVQVLNAGVVGYGPDQCLLRLKNEVDTLRPHLVIFHIFADNDFGDLLRNRLFVLDEAGQLVSTHHAPHPGDFKRGLHPPQGRLTRFMLFRAAVKLRHSMSGADFGPAKLRRYRAASAREYKYYLLDRAPQPTHVYDHYDIDLALDPGAPSSKLKARLMEKVLKKASELLQARKIRFLVVIQPSGVDLTKNFDLHYEVLSAHAGYSPENLTQCVVRACRQQDIAHVDLFPVFNEKDPGQLFLGGRNMHWNDAGQALAVRVTAEAIAKHWARLANPSQ